MVEVEEVLQKRQFPDFKCPRFGMSAIFFLGLKTLNLQCNLQG